MATDLLYGPQVEHSAEKEPCFEHPDVILPAFASG